MRQYNKSKQYFLLIVVTGLIYSCHAQDHHNHIDPVTSKYSQATAASIDPLNKPLATNTNIPKTDVEFNHDDEPSHDTIDARLQTKHNLRQSIHQQSVNDQDDKYLSEQEYINQLNAPLEKEQQFQPIPPSNLVLENVNNSLVVNQSLDNVQIPLVIPNETLSSTPTPPSVTIQPERRESVPNQSSRTHETVKESITILDEKETVKPVVIELTPPPIQQKPTDPPSVDVFQEKPVQEEIRQQTKTEPILTTPTPQPHTHHHHHHHHHHQHPTHAEKPSVNTVEPSIDQKPIVSQTPFNDQSNPREPIVDTKVNANLSTSNEAPKQSTTIDPVPKVITPNQQQQPKVDIVQKHVTVEASATTTPVTPSPVQTLPDPIESVDTIVNDTQETENSLATETVPTATPTPTATSTGTPPRVLRSATSRFQQQAQARQRHARSKQESNNAQIEPVNTTTENVTDEATPLATEEPAETSEELVLPDERLDEITLPVVTESTTASPETVDLPRQVHVHDASALLHEELASTRHEAEEQPLTTTVSPYDNSPHLPRLLDNDDLSTTTDTLTATATTSVHDHDHHSSESNPNQTQQDSKNDETTNNSLVNKSNNVPMNSGTYTSENISSGNLRQVCWGLPKGFEPSLDLVENQMLRFINLLPEFLQTVFFARVDNPEIVMNTLWFGSICIVCFLFSVLFLSMATKRLKQSKDEKEIRARCQQLQQYNNQLELERATFERQNQKLSDEIDELKTTPVRDNDDELFELREIRQRMQADLDNLRVERDAMQRELDQKQLIIQKHDFDMRQQIETVAHLNNEILQQKQELEKERATIGRLQTNDLSLERFEKLNETISDLKSENTQLKQGKFAQVDQLNQLQEQINQLDIENNQLTIKMKQLKEIIEQRDETIARIREKMNNENDEKSTDFGELLSTVPDSTSESNQQLLSTVDNDVEKSNQHLRQLHNELDEKTRRVKELDSLLNQEKDRSREMETKLKVVLELRERDAHLHIRQLGQTDAELRKARTDTERVRILQQQLELKQKQLEDVQKVMAMEQTKFTEECSKLQHETHEKWMEVKRLSRELDAAKKECEGLRRQITKYATNERSSQEKQMLKPVPQHLNNTGRLSSEPETNGSSPPPPMPYQQGDNFRPIDHQRNDSGAASPSEIFRQRPPPPFGMPRPPFFGPPFLPPPPNPFMMSHRFPMPMPGPHGMISPIAHLMTNGSAGGSDANSFEIVDSTNITPNSTSYDAPLNGSAGSPTPDDQQQPSTEKTKKPKKTVKKKTKNSTTPATTSKTPAAVAKEDV